MNAIARDWTPALAVREKMPLLIGLSGPPGSGKTFSALTLAQGIKDHRGGDIIVIDTDGDRALAYAPRRGQTANGATVFDFKHVTFSAPFGPDDFLAAVRAQLPSNPACIIIDVMSDEHEGEGGVLWQHDTELDRMTKGDYSKRDAMSMAAWIKPKAARRKMLNAFLKLKTPIIFCFQAREKTKPAKNDNGKVVPTNMGWTPISPAEIVQSMTIFCLLPIRSDGVPMWRGGTVYEDFTIKLPLQFKGLFPEGVPLNASMGAAMSKWAAGDDAAPPEQAGAPISQTQPSPEGLDHIAWAKGFEENLALIASVADLDIVRGDESNKACFDVLKAKDPGRAKALSAAINGRRKALADKEAQLL